MTHHSVEDEQQLVHAGGQGHLLGLAGGAQAGIEGPNDGVMAGGDERGHVEDRAHPSAPTPHDAPPPPAATLAVERSDPHERGDRLAVEATELGQVGQQGQSRGGADPRDAAHEILALTPEGTRLHPLAQKALQLGPLFFQPRDMALDVRPHCRQGRLEPLAFGGQHPHELAPPSEQRRELLGRRVGEGARRGVNDLGEACEDRRIERVGLGQLADGAGPRRAPGGD
jgi:hypothetical protein